VRFTAAASTCLFEKTARTGIGSNVETKAQMSKFRENTATQAPEFTLQLLTALIDKRNWQSSTHMKKVGA